jgi:hypothetical protein
MALSGMVWLFFLILSWRTRQSFWTFVGTLIFGLAGSLLSTVANQLLFGGSFGLAVAMLFILTFRHLIARFCNIPDMRS